MTSRFPRALPVLAVGALLALTSCGTPRQWRPEQENLPGAMLAIWGTSAQNVYAVGANASDGMGPMVLHYNGTAWQRLPTGLTSGDLWWIHGFSNDLAFVSGSDGVILRMNPAARTFERMTTPGASLLFGIWGADAQDLWAVGGTTDTASGTTASTLWHYDGTAWSDVISTLPATVDRQARLFKVWGTSRTDVWACGERGTVIHYDGTAWAAETSGTRQRLTTLHGSATQRYAVGGLGTAVLIEGGPAATWTLAATSQLPALNGVYVPATGDPVAVGISGFVARRINGVWTADAVPPGTGLDFHAVWIAPEGDVFAVGGRLAANPMNEGMIYRWR